LAEAFFAVLFLDRARRERPSEVADNLLANMSAVRELLNDTGASPGMNGDPNRTLWTARQLLDGALNPRWRKGSAV
jgi:hypothetical protein